MNLITCCYKCPNRKVGCHATCSDYAEGVAENAKRNALIRKEKEASYDVSFNRVCEQKLKNRKAGKR